MGRAGSHAIFPILSLVALLLAACESSPPPYQYQFIPGKSAVLSRRGAMVPSDAPEPVKRAVAAGNRIQGRPYIYGGGHRSFECRGLRR